MIQLHFSSLCQNKNTAFDIDENNKNLQDTTREGQLRMYNTFFSDLKNSEQWKEIKTIT